MAPGALAQVLCELPKHDDKNVLVGYDTSDDACVYRINAGLASVMTVDFFPPVVDDPYLFGQIAAANALSDIYAMGARPSHAMNLLCFPSCLDISVAEAILKGGADKAMEADCAIAGGHTINDDEPKYGLCVSGFVDPERIWRNSGAAAGDRLIMTKAAGTGILTTAVKGGLLSEDDIREATDSMRQLNRRAAETASGFTVHACTDVTGFGAAGHICEMAQGSGLTAVVEAKRVPLLNHAYEMARMGVIPAGAYRNREHFGSITDVCGIDTVLADIMFDPQTSGGLVLSIPEAEADELLSSLKAAGLMAQCIGHMMQPYDGIALKLV